MGNHSSIKKMTTIEVLIEWSSSCDREFWNKIGWVEDYVSILNIDLAQISKLVMNFENEKERQPLLEAILSYKERFTAIIRSCMANSEKTESKIKRQ